VRLVLASLTTLIVAAACGATRPAAEPPITDTPGPQSIPLLSTPRPRPQATVVELVDGDTLVLDIDGSEARVRLIGIDAPEADLDQCFAAAATAFVTAVASPGAILEVERDVTDRDAFGRLLRYGYLPDGSMLNVQLVRGGFARVTHQPPDDKYIERLREAEDDAQRDGVGLWSACGTPTPMPVVQATEVPTPAPAVTAAVATATEVTPPPTASPSPEPTPTPLPMPTSTPAPTATPTPTPTPTPTATATATATVDPRAGCDPSYPTVCIPPAPPDLDCGDITYRRFTVLPPDPHRLDGDKDGIGCES